MRKKSKKGRWLIGLLLVLGLPAWWLLHQDTPQSPQSHAPHAQVITPSPGGAPDAHKVKRIIDGDTLDIVYNGKTTRVRLIGVDTPETVHPNKTPEFYGREASMFLHNLLAGESVFLELDPVNIDRAHKDIYGRLLAYVYRANGRVFVNREIIRQGYGRVTTFQFKHADDFKRTERTARDIRKGLWRQK